MKAKTELLLYRLFWLAEKPFKRTYVDLEQSFEGWAYQNGLLSQIHRLEAQGLIESVHDPLSGRRLQRLTDAGRDAAHGGRNPEKAWATVWDGKWRLFLFDIPETESSRRRQLTRSLTKAGCGCLQGSVWISPFTPPAIEKLVIGDDPDCSHLLLLLADSKGQKADNRMVEAAWSMDRINAQYQKLEILLEQFQDIAKRMNRESLAVWTAAEKAASCLAIQIDPLLPSSLYPKSYIGAKVWKKRSKVLVDAARLAVILSDG